MQIQFDTAIFIALLAGLLGYLARTWMDHVRPFFEVVQVTGRFFMYDTKVVVSDTLVTGLKDSIYIKEIECEEYLGNLLQRYQRTEEIKRFWPDVIVHLDRFIGSTSEADHVDALAHLLSLESFDRWMMNVLLLDRLKFFTIPNLSIEKGGVHRNREDRNGCVWIELPDRSPIVFGFDLNQRVVAARVEPFLQRIGSRDWDGLKKPLAEFKATMEKEYKIAVASLDEFKAIVDPNSHWLFRCYFANLRNSPLAIEKSATIEVTDDVNGIKYPEETCTLVFLDKEREHETPSAFFRKPLPARHPLVIKPGAVEEFAFVTAHTQSEMRLGNALREAFDREQARVIVRISARTSGFRKQKVFASTATSFEETIFK